MKDSPANQDQRRFTRIPFDAEVALTFERSGRSILAQGTLMDISFKGLMVHLPDMQQLKKEMHGKATIHLTSSEVYLPLEVTVKHIEQETLGLHVDQMPIESAEHLRSLMLHNLGHDSLLQRELQALVEPEP